MERRTTRRAFLRNAAIGGAGLVILKNSLSARAYAANDKLNVALIGVGGRGKWFVDTIPKMEKVVALCDVNEKKATQAYRRFPDLPKYHDFRKMLDEMHRQIDAVVVAVPDHSHAVASVTAMKRGKHVFCEKPLTRTVYESRAMRKTAEKYQVATQMGNQGSSSGQFRRGVELIQDGLLGEIKEVYVWKDSGGPGHREPPKGTQRIPDYLKWDLWLGAAAHRPFHPRWMAWGGWRDFGTGRLGNWGAHSGYLAFTALDVCSLWHADPGQKPRIQVESQVSERNKLSFPKWEVVHLKIPKRGSMPPVDYMWINGGGAPGWRKRIEDTMGKKLDWGDAGERKWHDHAGALIVGTKGMIHATGHNATIELLPADEFRGVDKSDPKRLPRSRGHERDWLLACRGGKPPLSNFSNSGPYMEFLLLANVSTQFDERIEYDPLECKIVNSSRADGALRSERREGWSL